MLGKCAKAAGLRDGFADLGALYIDEEMDVADPYGWHCGDNAGGARESEINGNLFIASAVEALA